MRQLHRRLAPPALLGLTLLLAFGCGKKGPPQPPPLVVPATTTDLRVWQRGNELLLTFTYPTTTPSGAPLSGIEALELWRMSRSLRPEVEPADELEAEPPPGEAEAEQSEESEADEPPPSPFQPVALPEVAATVQPEATLIDGREFALLAEPLLRLEGEELDTATSGSQIVLRVPLEATPEAEPAELLAFAVLTVSTRGLASPLSNVALLAPRPPPQPPTAVEAEPGDRGVEISWVATEAPEVGFRVYRRDPGSRAHGEPIAAPPPDARSHLDTTAAFGTRYVYSVTTVALAAPLVESALTAEREIDYQDRYPPPAPDGLIVLAEPRRVRLLWEPSDAPDVAGYRVWRQSGGGGEFAEVTTEPQLELEFVDSTAPSGSQQAYFVTALDGNGNESPASEVVEVVVP